MARLYESGGASSNADKTINQIAAAAAGRSVTTPEERARESGQRYGSTNPGAPAPSIPAAAPVDELNRESGAFYGSDNTGVNTNTAPAGRTMAMDTFKQTLGNLFGAGEMDKPWVAALYKVVSGYYTTGSTIAEALNLSLTDAENNPDLATFKDRFAPIYAIRERLRKGEAVAVPTIAEYVKSESDLGDIFREAGLGELATQKFLGDVLTFKSVLTAGNLITDIFSRIDNAPSALKNDLTSMMGLGISRTDIAKALLTGKDGFDALDKKVKQLTVFSAAKTQGVDIGMDTATDLANTGDYANSLDKFKTVKQLERGQALGSMSGIDYTQKESIDSTFYSNAAAAEKERIISEQEINRFKARSGRLQSQNRNVSGLI